MRGLHNRRLSRLSGRHGVAHDRRCFDVGRNWRIAGSSVETRADHYTCTFLRSAATVRTAVTFGVRQRFQLAFSEAPTQMFRSKTIKRLTL